MIDKDKVGKLAQEIAVLVREIRRVIQDGPTEDNAEDHAIADHVVMLGAATKLLGEACGVKIQ